MHGPNEVRRKASAPFWREVATQLAHPLALLLWAAAALAFVADLAVLGQAVLAVIVVNAGFAPLQERQAERAVETLARYLPEHALVVRDGRPLTVEARDLVPGDVIVLEEGDKVPADGRVTEGGVEVDLSMLTGESVPAERVAVAGLLGAPLLEEPNIVFSGTTCVEGQARAVVFATGDRTELGRIAALSQRTRREPSPLERQVKKAARQGALVKRLSAVGTLGSTSVICTDKTGTLTRNRMRLRAHWTPGHGTDAGPWAQAPLRAAAECTTVARDTDGELHGDPPPSPPSWREPPTSEHRWTSTGATGGGRPSSGSAHGSGRCPWSRARKAPGPPGWWSREPPKRFWSACRPGPMERRPEQRRSDSPKLARASWRSPSATSGRTRRGPSGDRTPKSA